jgi:hypothetical protein
MSEQQKTDLNMRVEVVEVAAGEILWAKNSVPEYALFICKGEFQLSSEKTIGLSKGQLIGDFPALIRGKKTTSQLKCNSIGEILRIKKHQILEFLTNNPGLFIYLKDKFIID